MRIDWWTLALQAVNVLILVWLLTRFLYRPVVAMIAERREAAQKLLSDAVAARDRAETDAAAIDHRLQGVAAERDRILAEARAAAEAERTRLLQQAGELAAHTQREAIAAIAKERLITERALRQSACDLAITVARRLLQRLPAKIATAALLDAVSAAMTQLPEDQRRNLATSEGPVDIATAAALDAQEQTACREIIARVLGRTPVTIFQTDPSLIAGVELRTPQMLIRSSWRADLERIADELRGG